MKTMKAALTTGQVAKICEVAPRTVTIWFDKGLLRGYRIPGSLDRRIPREHLVRFLKENGMPLGLLESAVVHKVLIVGADPSLQASLKEHLRESDGYQIETAASAFEAGVLAESFRPDCIIIDLAMGRMDAGQIVQNLRKNKDQASTILLALTSEGNAVEVFNLGFNDVFKKPVDGDFLADMANELIAKKKANEP